jgi:apolipoprotein D and lipocalin family protein
MLGSQLKQLDMEIRDAEALVRLHDDRLQHSARMLKDNIGHALGGKLVMAGAAVGGTLLTIWLVRRSLPSRGTRRLERAVERGARRTGVRVAQALRTVETWGPLLLPLLAPLLHPKVAATLSRLGVPVPVQKADPLPTAERFEPDRFAGHWYEIARLPTRHERKCVRDASAEYSLDAEGVLRVTNRCVRDDGQLDEAKGVLRASNRRRPGELEVSFAPAILQWWPGSWADFYVIHVDDDYRMALVGTPDRDSLWVLSRDRMMPAADFESLKALAQRHGFDTSRLMATPQTSDGDIQPKAG